MDRQLFKETFSQLHASGDTITEVMKMAEDRKYRNSHMRRPARTGALIALAAVLLMGTALAVSAANGGLYGLFFGTEAVDSPAASGESGTVTVEAHEATYVDEVKGPITFDVPGYQLVDVDTEEAERLIGQYVRVMDEAYTVDGVTVTMLGYIEDEAGTCRLYYSIEDPNGLDYETYDDNGYTCLAKTAWGGRVDAGPGKGTYIDTERSTDTKLFLCVSDVRHEWQTSSGEPVAIFDSRAEDAPEGEYVPPVEEFTVAADALVPAETLENDDFRILVSPMGATVTCLNNAPSVTLGDGTEVIVGVEFLQLSFTMRDGTEYTVTGDNVRNCTYICGSADGQSETYCFNRLIDPAQIASVTVTASAGDASLTATITR